MAVRSTEVRRGLGEHHLGTLLSTNALAFLRQHLPEAANSLSPLHRHRSAEDASLDEGQAELLARGVLEDREGTLVASAGFRDRLIAVWAPAWLCCLDGHRGEEAVPPYLFVGDRERALETGWSQSELRIGSWRSIEAWADKVATWLAPGSGPELGKLPETSFNALTACAAVLADGVLPRAQFEARLAEQTDESGAEQLAAMVDVLCAADALICADGDCRFSELWSAAGRALGAHEYLRLEFGYPGDPPATKQFVLFGREGERLLVERSELKPGQASCALVWPSHAQLAELIVSWVGKGSGS